MRLWSQKISESTSGPGRQPVSASPRLKGSIFPFHAIQKEEDVLSARMKNLMLLPRKKEQNLLTIVRSAKSLFARHALKNSIHKVCYDLILTSGYIYSVFLPENTIRKLGIYLSRSIVNTV